MPLLIADIQTGCATMHSQNSHSCLIGQIKILMDCSIILVVKATPRSLLVAGSVTMNAGGMRDLQYETPESGERKIDA